jgi:segregation and condensation protein B
MDNDFLTQVIEALIFASDNPISIEQICTILENDDKEAIGRAIESLAEKMNGRAIFLKKVSGGYQFATKPEYARWIKRMYDVKAYSRLTRAALETLAIIAFKQPISRVEVSAIRGVNSDGVIKGLLERKLITISGRDHGPGRALLFTTTKEFLQYFAINEISDLPKPKEVEELLSSGEGERLIRELPEEKLLNEPIQNPEHDGASANAQDGSDDSPNEEKLVSQEVVQEEDAADANQ